MVESTNFQIGRINCILRDQTAPKPLYGHFNKQFEPIFDILTSPNNSVNEKHRFSIVETCPKKEFVDLLLIDVIQTYTIYSKLGIWFLKPLEFKYNKATLAYIQKISEMFETAINNQIMNSIQWISDVLKIKVIFLPTMPIKQIDTVMPVESSELLEANRYEYIPVIDDNKIYNEKMVSDIYNLLRQAFASSRENVEVELTICKLYKDGIRLPIGIDRNRMQKVESGVAMVKFLHILYAGAFEYTGTIDTFYENNVRVSKSIVNGNIISCVRKIPIDKINIPTGMCYDMRLSVSSEQPAKLPPDGAKSTAQRIKHRHSIIVDFIQIDITRVISAGETAFEVEFEFLTLPTFDVFKKWYQTVVLPTVDSTNLEHLNNIEQHWISYLLPAPSAIDRVASLLKVIGTNLTVKRLTNQVLSLTRKNIGTISNLSTYLISPKYDGKRTLVLIDNGKMTAISDVVNEYDIQSRSTMVLDTEEYGGIYYVFDVLYYDKLITQQPLKDRLAYIKHIVSLDDKRLSKKPHYATNLIDDALACVENIRCDGIIFTPLGSYMEKTYKWKPAEQLTIDFYLVQYNAQSYRLMVGSKHQNRLRPVQFKVNNVPQVYKGENGLDGQIGEFLYDRTRTQWILVRKRPDRLQDLNAGTYFGNFITVAISIFDDIQNPLTLHDVKESFTSYFKQHQSEEHRISREVNNAVKKRLIMNYFKNCDVVMDLAAGKGQDVHKFNEAGVKTVVAIEIDKTANNEFIRRSANLRTKFILINDDLSKPSSELINDIDSLNLTLAGRVDGVLCSLAAHYWLTSDNALEEFGKLLEHYMKDGSKLVMTFFDKTRVVNNLPYVVRQNNKEKYSITPNHNDGRFIKVNVLLPFSDTPYTETLIDIEWLRLGLLNHGIRLVSQTNFDELAVFPKDATSDDQKYVGFYIATVWEKTSQPEAPSFLIGLKHRENNCYVDSVLVALFANDIPIVDDYLLERKVDDQKSNLRKELTKVAARIKARETSFTSSKLRAATNIPCNSFEPFYDTEQHDSGEFLQFLFNTFNFDSITQTITTVHSHENDRVEDVKHIKTTPIVIIVPTKDSSLEKMLPIVDESEFEHIVDGKGYTKKTTTTTFSETDFLVFYVNRLSIVGRNERRNTSIVRPNRKIGKLKLYGIVVHTGMHYTLYIRDDTTGNWYYYNDISTPTTHVIGKYDDMIASNPSPSKYGTLFFYKI